MKTVLAFFLLSISGIARAQSVSVAGPIMGLDPVSGTLLSVDQASQTTEGFCVYAVDGTDTPIEASGIFYFQGIAYPTGYQFAHIELLYCKNLNL